MELEQPNFDFELFIDRRPRMTEPPPVRLVAVEDVRGWAGNAVETLLDEFYSGLLQFEREPGEPGQIVYRAENFRLRLEVLDAPSRREDLRPIVIDVPLLSLVHQQLIDCEVDFQWLKGLPPVRDTLLLRDPAGNWVQIGQFKRL